jgi:hypothetical protein
MVWAYRKWRRLTSIQENDAVVIENDTVIIVHIYSYPSFHPTLCLNLLSLSIVMHRVICHDLTLLYSRPTLCPNLLSLSIAMHRVICHDLTLLYSSPCRLPPISGTGTPALPLSGEGVKGRRVPRGSRLKKRDRISCIVQREAAACFRASRCRAFFYFFTAIIHDHKSFNLCFCQPCPNVLPTGFFFFYYCNSTSIYSWHYGSMSLNLMILPCPRFFQN